MRADKGGKEKKMKKYIVVVSNGLQTIGMRFISASRNAKKHLIDTGANDCIVYTMNNEPISAAKRDENGIPHNVILPC